MDESVSNASGVFSPGELREANDTAHRACVLAPAQLSETVRYLNSADHLLRKHRLFSYGGFQPHPRACFMSGKMEVKQVPSHYLTKGSETGKVDGAYVWEGHSRETNHRNSDMAQGFIVDMRGIWNSPEQRK